MDRADWLAGLGSDGRPGIGVILLGTPMIWRADCQPPEVPLSRSHATALGLLAVHREGLASRDIETALGRKYVASVVKTLRQNFPTEVGEAVIASRPRSQTGYVLSRDLCEIDSLVFENELRQAVDDLRGGELTRAANRAGDAITFWCGGLAALRGCEDQEQLADESFRLRRGIILAWWVFARAGLACGRASLVESRLRTIVRLAGEESLWAAFMYASDRVDTTGTHQAARELHGQMVEDLDLEGQQTVSDEVLRCLVDESDCAPEILDLFGASPHSDPLRMYDWRDDVACVATPISSAAVGHVVAEAHRYDGDDPVPAGIGGATREGRQWSALRVVAVLVIVGAAVAAMLILVLSRRGGEGPVVAMFSFDTAEDLEGWKLSDQPLGDCYLDDVGVGPRLVEDAERGSSVELVSNPDREAAKSHHVLIGKGIGPPLDPGRYELRFSSLLPAEYGEQTQTGPEASIQDTRDGLTRIAAVQAAANPWVKKLQIWVELPDGRPDWFALPGVYEPTLDEWVEVALSFDTAAGTYEALTFETAPGQETLRFDLSSFRLGSDRRGFEDGAVVTLEAENLWTCRSEEPQRTSTSVRYDDVSLTRTDG